MKPMSSALATLLLLSACGQSALTPSTDDLRATSLSARRETAQTIKDEVIVKYRAGFRTQSSTLPLKGASVLDAFNTSDETMQLHRLPKGAGLDESLKTYSADPGVEFAIPNVKFQVQMKIAQSDPKVQTGTTMRGQIRPTSSQISAQDPLSNQQWHLQHLKMPEVWLNYGTGSADVHVAVLDTGVDYDHPDLKDRVILGPDYIDRDNDPKDRHGHGTHVAGIIAASLNNNEGVAGVAPNVKIMAIRVLGEDGSGSLFNIAKGIAYAANNGSKVINLSLGSPPGGLVMRTLANFMASYAESKGALIVAAAGNEGGEIGYPAAASKFLAVGATNETNILASFSNRGPELDVVAPGVNIFSTFPTYEVSSNRLGLSKNYASLNGTSMATPVVAAQAALLLSRNPTWKPKQVRERIESTSRDLGMVGRDDIYGFGVVSVLDALSP